MREAEDMTPCGGEVSRHPAAAQKIEWNNLCKRWMPIDLFLLHYAVESIVSTCLSASRVANLMTFQAELVLIKLRVYIPFYVYLCLFSASTFFWYTTFIKRNCNLCKKLIHFKKIYYDIMQ